MQAGKLRHRVTVQDATPTADTFGERDLAWADTATVWASVEPMSGRELVAAQQLVAEATVKIRMRYTAVTPDSRIKFGTRYFDILHKADSENRNATIELLCREVA